MKNSDPDKFRTFGRAKGKKLSPAQQGRFETLYPKVKIDTDTPLTAVNTDSPVWFEIGFGGSEHLIWQAEQNPNVTIMGAEPFQNGIAKALRSIEDKSLSNVRLHHGDARDIMENLADGSLDKVFVLFPDPWPKTKHHKRRLINAKFLEHVHRILKPGGEFRFGSDIIHYVDWTLTRVKSHGGFSWNPKSQSDWRERAPDWPSTRYLEKALREGRSGHFFHFIRRYGSVQS